MSSPDPQAVFLSYASQDAAAVRRIAEALRAAGVEVWFDQNELVGGDAWDAKIRKQIAECALFVPVISAATQARLEGYFRLEWKLAAQRTHTMADEKVFLLPVVIDDTRDTEAKVPAEFKAVQWTRLRPVGFGGQARDDASVAAFCARIGKVLGGEGRDPSPRRPSSEVDKTPGRLGETSLPAKGSRLWLVPVILGVTAVAVLALWRPWRETAPPRVAPASVSSKPSNSASAAAANEKSAPGDKSLVVLPLENLSPDPDHAFFTDGMHSEIIQTLSRIAELKVISRDSALALKGLNISLAEKAQKVGVANVIVGSVRREGTRVIVTLELRRAHDEKQLWAQRYDKQLGEGMLAIQLEIAEQVSRALQARESKGAYAGAQFMTANPEAYDLFLKGRLTYFSDRGPAGREKAIEALEKTLALDPQFSSAARLLGHVNVQSYVSGTDPQRRFRNAHDAKRWAETAHRLQPDGAGDDTLADYYSWVEPDNARALALAESAAKALPNDAAVHIVLGNALKVAGRSVEAVAAFRQAVTLDPLNLIFRNNLLSEIAWLRRPGEFDDAHAEYAAVGVAPDFWPLRFQRSGTLPTGIGVRQFQLSRRDADAVERIDASLAKTSTPDLALRSALTRWQLSIQKCDSLLRLGRETEWKEALEEARRLTVALNEEPHFDESERDGRSAQLLARLGKADEAIAAGRRYVAARSPTNQVRSRREREIELAQVYAYLTRPRECCQLLALLLRVPSGLTVPMLKGDPAWDNMREDPAFKALLADPKNSAPL